MPMKTVLLLLFFLEDPVEMVRDVFRAPRYGQKVPKKEILGQNGPKGAGFFRVTYFAPNINICALLDP